MHLVHALPDGAPALLWIGGAGLFLLLALGCLLIAVALGTRSASTRERAVSLGLIGLFLAVVGVVVERIGAPVSAIAAYVLVVALVAAAAITGLRARLRVAG
jgi:hypothetical protein